ncbi:imidazolonepropionase [Algivirga pacifica]|uniref:Imidazolonepropionase n=1 Tax=Algivirga pacifica TaxID=1162670 RepID=A0ABP9D7Z2_9BACT
MKLIGPFTQALPLADLPMKGAIADEDLKIIEQAGVLLEDGKILAVDTFDKLQKENPEVAVTEIQESMVLLPSFVDCHTHICWGGNRARDYAMRIAGKPYLEIARAGGGIWDSVTKTRAASEGELTNITIQRANRHLADGITTIEVKSGYALDVENELKMLKAIKNADREVKADLVSTCLAAHIKPKDFEGDAAAYLQYILENLLPEIKQQGLSNRVDIFIEDTAFNEEVSVSYLLAAKAMGFEITIHADQFSTGGSAVGKEVGAVSVEHLESSTEEEIRLIADSDMVAVALPGASLGLGMQYTPSRKLLDAGACLAIATDWNPGSAPMGDLLMQAAVLSASEKLSSAEVFAGITYRAAAALNLNDRGRLAEGMLGDMVAFPCETYQEILYQQGRLKPTYVWKKGEEVEGKR